MYLHLGQNVVVPETDVIGIFDLDNTTCSRITRDFLSGAERSGRIISVSEELPNSFVVCGKDNSNFAVAGRAARGTPRGTGASGMSSLGGVSGASGTSGLSGASCMSGKDHDDTGIIVYLSQLSSQTLYKRTETMRFD